MLHKNDEKEFSKVNEIREYYLQQYESVVDSNMVKNNIKAILESFILIIITSIGVAIFYREKDN